MNKRLRLKIVEDSYNNDSVMSIVAAGIRFTGRVVDFLPDFSFLLMLPNGETINFYLDEVHTNGLDNK